MSAGFYKYDLETELLFFEPEFAKGKDGEGIEYEIFSESHDEYNYPIDGWYWMKDAEQARKFFAIKIPASNMIINK